MTYQIPYLEEHLRSLNAMQHYCDCVPHQEFAVVEHAVSYVVVVAHDVFDLALDTFLDDKTDPCENVVDLADNDVVEIVDAVVGAVLDVAVAVVVVRVVVVVAVAAYDDNAGVDDVVIVAALLEGAVVVDCVVYAAVHVVYSDDKAAVVDFYASLFPDPEV